MAFKSRDKYARQIADTIKLHHAKAGSESFIFGISGKWGEGKTDFLGKLKHLLSKDGFTVVSINPWKYAEDRIAFLRYFILELSKYVSDPPAFREQHHLDELECDISTSKIELKQILGLTVLCGIVLALGLVSPFVLDSLLSLLNIEPALAESAQEGLISFRNFFLYFWPFFLVSLLPIFTGSLEKMSTRKISSSSVSTLDKFDDLLCKVVDRLKVKIVIFVDDLDRLSPQVARNVLDNLRTFFDKPELSYVVTADHTVLERFIGSQILPNEDDLGKVTEEGRRFWKKIFNYYWRLPVPIDSEFDDFLDERLSPYKNKLEKFLGDEISNFKIYLRLYFGKNLREVGRFIDYVIFTFEIIEIQLQSSKNEEERKPFQTIKQHPKLMLRTLLIQELCSAFFEKLLTNSEPLSRLEYNIARRIDATVNSLIQDEVAKKKTLSQEQAVLLKSLLNQGAGFCDPNEPWGVLVDIEPFLHLAADSSFGQSVGAKAIDVIALVKRGDTEGVKRSLLSSSRPSLTSYSDAMIELLKQESADQDFASYLTTLVQALLLSAESVAAQEIFFEKIKKIDFSKIITPTTEAKSRIKTISVLLEWLDLQLDKKPDSIAAMTESFGFLNDNDRQSLLESTPKELNVGVSLAVGLRTEILAQWLAKRYSTEKVVVTRLMVEKFPLLNSKIISNHLAGIYENFCTDIIQVNNAELRSNLLTLISKFLPKKISNLKDKVLEAIKSNLDGTLYDWAIDVQDDDIWERKVIENVIIEHSKGINDMPNLKQIFSFLRSGEAQRIEESLSNLWEVLIGKIALLVEFMKEAANDSSTFDKVIPPNETAEKLFGEIVKLVKSTEDQNEKTALLSLLNANNWFWRKLGTPDGHKLRSIKAIGDAEEASSGTAKNVLESWDKKK